MLCATQILVSRQPARRVSGTLSCGRWADVRLADTDPQDHYTFSQPGIQRMVFKMKELVHRIDGLCLNVVGSYSL